MMQIMDIALAQRLRHIDLLRKMPTKKGIIDIKLENSPLAIECNNAQLFVKAFSNKASFIPYNNTVEILFDVKHSFVAHYILPPS